MEMEPPDKDDLRVAVVTLRALRGWSQAELAAATGLGASAVSRYESGAQVPSERTFERIAAASGVPPLLIRSLLDWIHAARSCAAGRSLHGGLEDLIEVGVAGLASELTALIRKAAMELLQIRKREARARKPTRSAQELWAALETVPDEGRRFLVEEASEFQSCPLCTLLCDRSLESGNAAEALELAGLAVRITEVAPLEADWKLRLQGYALAHLADAHRKAGDLDVAEEVFQRAQALWESGRPGDPPEPLDGSRLRDVEVLLRAKQEEQRPALPDGDV